MDDEARAREATRETIDDISPPGLHELLDQRLDTADVTPGVLTLLSARATGERTEPTDLDRRAAGVQLIYEGLALTRRLARYPPWPGDHEATEADMQILAADVLVGRGFFLLARTEAAPVAVETVRSFGRDETVYGRDNGNDHALETDVFELAIVAGATATGADPPASAREFAADLASTFERGRRTLACDRTVDALDELLAEREADTPTPDRVWSGAKSDP